MFFTSHRDTYISRRHISANDTQSSLVWSTRCFLARGGVFCIVWSITVPLIILFLLYSTTLYWQLLIFFQICKLYETNSKFLLVSRYQREFPQISSKCPITSLYIVIPTYQYVLRRKFWQSIARYYYLLHLPFSSPLIRGDLMVSFLVPFL